MDISYSPYKEQKTHHKKTSFKLPKIKIPKSVKIWVGIIAGIILITLFILYLSLGELRFFANHYFGLTFFKKNYLIVLQNNYELRPGGGFVTAYGELDTLLGWPGDPEFKNSYDIDTDTYVTPPFPHEDLLKNEWYEGYTFRDANWYPDASKSVQELIGFYKKKFPDKNVNGVIFINFSLIEKLIGKLGGVELNEKMLTRKNLFSELEFEVNNIDRHNIEALNNRKNVLGELAGVLMKSIKHNPYKTRDMIIQGLHDKDLYIWLENASLQQKLEEKGWANVMKTVDRSDFLAVNLANLGSKKADRYVQTEVHYFANITNDLPEISTEVTIRYPGNINTYSDNYKGYLRLYMPKNADISSFPVDSIEETEGDFKVIGTKIILPAGNKTTLNYIYTLSRNAFLRDEYRLRLIKQSGSEKFYRLTIETGEGKLLEGEDFDTRENRAYFMGKLKNDMDFSLKIMPDMIPPYPIEQIFTDLHHINIYWNEPLDSTTAAEPSAFSIADLNKAVETTDEVTVTTAELIQPNVIKLGLEGITDQEGEHYRIDLAGLKDQSGNLTIPNPKSITAVQRIKPASEVPEIKLGEIPVTPEEMAEQPAQ